MLDLDEPHPPYERRPVTTQEREAAPGVRLGLPAEGPGSVAGVGRRLAGVLLDGIASYLVASLFVRRTQGGVPTPGGWSSLVFLIESVVLLSVTGQTLGMALVRVRVVPLSGSRIHPWWAAVRTVLLLMLIPAVVWDSDHRGLHDKASGVVVVNS
jgi:uncharacterized RDD family membrane protein YckC